MTTTRRLLILAICFLPFVAACDPDAAVEIESFQPLETQTSSRSWSSKSFAGQQIDSTRYRLYTTAENYGLVRRMPGFMEAANDQYRRLTGLQPEEYQQKLPIYLMATRRQWASLTRRAVGRDLPIAAGGYCYKGVCVFWDIGSYNTFSVAAHEGLHQFLYHHLEDPLPMALEEGLATISEGYEIRQEGVRFTPDKNSRRYTDLRAAIINRHWKSLDTLLYLNSEEANQGSQQESLSYYGQVWALMDFIQTDPGRKAAFHRLLQDAAAGKLHETVGLSRRQFQALKKNQRQYNRRVSRVLFVHYFGDDLETFEREYTRHARKLGGIVQTPSVNR
ncbi:MAG: hypothetical protein ACLFVU_07985 [Phycisphaerae bacterium]